MFSDVLPVINHFGRGHSTYYGTAHSDDTIGFSFLIRMLEAIAHSHDAIHYSFLIRMLKGHFIAHSGDTICCSFLVCMLEAHSDDVKKFAIHF